MFLPSSEITTAAEEVMQETLSLHSVTKNFYRLQELHVVLLHLLLKLHSFKLFTYELFNKNDALITQ